MKNLRSTVRKIANDLRRNFDEEIERNPSRFKRLVQRLLQAELPPRPGRPRSNHITLAVAMRERGESWREVYAACVTQDLSGDSRQLAQARLRAAVRARVRRKNVSRNRFDGSRGSSRDDSGKYA